MWTLVQWKQARRVDHFKVGALNVRYRGTPDQQLKSFDQLVTDYHAAMTNQARAVCLGEIVARAAAFAPGAHAVQTKSPVAALAAAAEQDLRLLLAGRDVDADGALGDLKVAPTGWGLKRVRVNTWIVVPEGRANQSFRHIDTMIDTHLQAATALYASAGMQLSVTRSNMISTVSSRVDPAQAGSRTNSLLDYTPDPSNLSAVERTHLAALTARAGTFSMDARARVAGWLNRKAMPANSIDLVYVPAFTEDDAQGLTTRPNSVGLSTTPNRPYVTIGWNPLDAGLYPTAATTFPTTLAHELLHALMDEGTHTSDASNLMAGGADRNGTNVISTAQMAIARHSNFI